MAAEGASTIGAIAVDGAGETLPVGSGELFPVGTRELGALPIGVSEGSGGAT